MKDRAFKWMIDWTYEKNKYLVSFSMMLFDQIVLFFWQVLEKMRPIDQKLKYQIDKLIKTAATGSAGNNF